MSSPSTFNYHRRSLSASSPSPSPVPKVSWRPASKRVRSSCNSPALPDSASPQTRNFDFWRTGKRLRRDISVRADDISSVYPRVTNYLVCFQPPSLTYTTGSSTPTSTDSHSSGLSSSAPHTPLFATTPEDFLLFPGRSSPRETVSEKSSSTNLVGIRDSHSDISEADATRLRSDAFWELRRSIAVSGEGLVKRMRDFEHSRSKSGIYKRARTVDRQRSKKRHSPSVPVTRSVRRSNSSDSDEDDIQIYSGELCGLPIPRQKRASSLGPVDMDDDEMQSSPLLEYVDQASTRSSSSNDDADNLSRRSFNSTFPPDTLHSTSSSPAYKYSAYTTAFSPPLSGPSFSSPARSFEVPRSSPMQNSIFLSSHPTAASFASSQEDVSLNSSASRTEKAIAALSLAIANGAAGLGDYDALRDIPSVMIDSQVGELWH
ncbi:uncharacterized protein F5891DRAFT_1073483 [Suillus fuscotomentosus]|uniref:Uncharacterized protein n=1 Tax=Suillus fuscotomentosus TaxID=1912939 RepID=A0AAD4DQH0_9AGAM|nr:uncharacterized protein F5891DRAFT_1073483 [Suillus fuscotomentosus]KAG1889646.1 hypothetical protein F5891DRAFT_1073483 [Suillus fuscotomentosus]